MFTLEEVYRAAKAATSNPTEQLIAKGMTGNEVMTLQNGKQFTVLMIYAATYSRASQKIARLVQAGAQVNTQSADGYTALMFAVMERHEQNVDRLLRLKADCSIRDHEGRTARDLVPANAPRVLEIFTEMDRVNEKFAKQQQIEREKAAKAEKAKEKAALAAATTKANAEAEEAKKTAAMITKIQQYMVKNVNCVNKQGYTLLMQAALIPDVDTVNILLAGGANIRLTNNGRTALGLVESLKAMTPQSTKYDEVLASLTEAEKNRANTTLTQAEGPATEAKNSVPEGHEAALAKAQQDKEKVAARQAAKQQEEAKHQLKDMAQFAEAVGTLLTLKYGQKRDTEQRPTVEGQEQDSPNAKRANTNQ